MISRNGPAGDRPATIVAQLKRWAAERPEARVYTFLQDGEVESGVLTYAMLDRRATAIAAELCRHYPPGARLLLLYEQGLEFIEALWGCFYAGMLPVPVAPPDLSGVLARTLPRLRAVLRDCGAEVVLTSARLLESVSLLLRNAPELEGLRFHPTDSVPSGSEVAPTPAPDFGPDALALLQYTSGSTGTPRGVVVTHRNLVANQEMILESLPERPGVREVFVSWLPFYHDMGLIGMLMNSAYRGGHAVMMAPLDFIRRPVRWLRAISRYGGTLSGAPNFGYDLCVQRVPPEQLAGEDLSSWRIAFNGAEPVRAQSLEAFARTFARCGFRAEALWPVYGLAEATLLVSGRRANPGALVRSVSERALENHEVTILAEEESGTRRLVGCGEVPQNSSVRIVDPDSGEEMAPGRVGEIWVTGEHVCQGYWGQPELTERTFRATLKGRPNERYLRTGDFGFLNEGQLFITGRRKDLIIIRGRNHYPHDLELTAEASHGSIRAGGTAAFSVDTGEGEVLAIVAEVKPQAGIEPQQIARAIEDAVAREHQLAADAVVLVQPGTIPKTSSGKLQRSACRAKLLGRELDTVLEWVRPGSSLRPSAGEVASVRTRSTAT